MHIRLTNFLSLALLLFVHVLLLGFESAKAADGPVTVFAAASLTNVVTEAAEAFEEKTGTKIRLSFAGSSTLARQIEAGADADIYLSANVVWADYLLDRGLLNPDKQFRQISNQLVLVAPSGTNTPLLQTLTQTNLMRLLGTNGLLAMGDPDHVPAGLYGKQALKALKLWAPIRTRVARADNVRGALALVSRGEVPLAIVYQSDIVGLKNLRLLHQFDPKTTDIRYAIEMIKGKKSAAANQFFAYLTGKEGLTRFERHGFSVMQEE